MIFLTVGTHEPFDRLVRAVDEWCAARGASDEVFGQITSRGAYRPRNFEWTETLAPTRFEQCFARAQLIVAHAGMGTILTALSRGTPIIVLPRRGHLGETRNDHQFATAQHLRGRPGLSVALSEDDLGAQLDTRSASAADPISPFAEDALITTLRDFIHE